MKKIINLLAEIDDYGLRVDQFIIKYEQSLSRSKIKNLIIKKNVVDQFNLNIIKQKWKDAFLTTPHGHPVKIN